jgi:trans-aconitate 2-methyltransferase
MQRWSPEQYLAFSDLRRRPARDLLARVPHGHPRRIVDVGCGPGSVTRLLCERWPDAEVIGVDRSPEMLQRARVEIPPVEWIEADMATWRPTKPVDLIFSNAALHWLDDPADAMLTYLGMLQPSGVLAVQMPHNQAAPSHTGMAEAIGAMPNARRLEAHLRHFPVAEPAYYYDCLRPHVAWLDIWETEYLQVLEGKDSVLEWTKGTALAPLLEAMNADEKECFLDLYRAKMRAAYPPRADGGTLFPFRRLFIVAGLP